LARRAICSSISPRPYKAAVAWNLYLLERKDKTSALARDWGLDRLAEFLDALADPKIDCL